MGLRSYVGGLGDRIHPQPYQTEHERPAKEASHIPLRLPYDEHAVMEEFKHGRTCGKRAWVVVKR